MLFFKFSSSSSRSAGYDGASNVPPPKQIDFSSQTIPELIYTRAKSDRVAAVFDAEKVSYTFAKVATEVFLSAFAACRAGLVFSLVNPNFHDSDSFFRALKVGDFKAVICFRANDAQDYLYSLLKNICPELTRSHKGQLKSVILPNLTHVILAEEDHRHSWGKPLLEGSCGRNWTIQINSEAKNTWRDLKNNTKSADRCKLVIVPERTYVERNVGQWRLIAASENVATLATL
ncbi:hypothetical protein TELCIR_17748 [Teladorsagia circumcincta]|uniref:AMP-dependent synthetase/ligase domain-containing protein n=1 Tax=Teladorsagia circumcincta TaxID=45464 RepID=A0A2G9TS35_TELCI|nr:hypothetical protein TELCIR_17748 [Teladorsagia circumcincta]